MSTASGDQTQRTIGNRHSTILFHVQSPLWTHFILDDMLFAHPLTTLRKLAQIECCKNNNCYYYLVSNISRVHTSCNQMEPLRASDQKKHEEICFEEIREISVLGYCDKFNTEHNMCQLDTPVILLGCDKFWNMISSSFSSHYISRSDSGSHH